MDAAPIVASRETLPVAPPMGAEVRPPRRPMQVVLMGPPGAGKGTQAGTVADLAGVAHVASGDLFRDAAKSGSELGRSAKAYMDRGELVPDDLTVAMVVQRLREPDARRGFILDGFPRSVAQAEALDEMLAEDGRRIDRVINLQVPEDVLLARLSGRWLCSICHTSYHTLFNPPRVEGICDREGGELYQRVDDREETARKRLEVYFAQTTPVLEYYRDRGILQEMPGDRPVAEVTRSLQETLSRPIEDI